jgi:hypothetical protein
MLVRFPSWAMGVNALTSGQTATAFEIWSAGAQKLRVSPIPFQRVFTIQALQQENYLRVLKGYRVVFSGTIWPALRTRSFVITLRVR